jgi:Xaa-Pro dipeptidase
MISRRHFVQAGAVSAAVLGATPFVRGAIAESTLPPSITALKSMKDRAKPITVEERRERQAKARRLMESNRIDALLLMEGTSLDYFTGIRWWG